jgi:hypothetical protein
MEDVVVAVTYNGAALVTRWQGSSEQHPTLACPESLNAYTPPTWRSQVL